MSIATNRGRLIDTSVSHIGGLRSAHTHRAGAVHLSFGDADRMAIFDHGLSGDDQLLSTLKTFDNLDLIFVGDPGDYIAPRRLAGLDDEDVLRSRIAEHGDCGNEHSIVPFAEQDLSARRHALP
jgi:hypothetical protein